MIIFCNFIYKVENKLAIKKPIVYAQGKLLLFSTQKRALNDISVVNEKIAPFELEEPTARGHECLQCLNLPRNCSLQLFRIAAADVKIGHLPLPSLFATG